MNTERIYQTTIRAEELAQTLADYFGAQEYAVQTFRTTEGRTVMQARKESLWRDALGVAYAATVTLVATDGELRISLGSREWVDTALSGVIGLIALPPVLIGTIYGVWKENELDKEVWRVIDERLGGAAPVMAASPQGAGLP